MSEECQFEEAPIVGNGQVNFTDEVRQHKDEINCEGTRRQGNRMAAMPTFREFLMAQ